MRIWFNHWFSTVFHLINLIKKGSPNRFTIIGSSEQDTVVYRNACDEWFVEPSAISDEEYVAYCVSFCKEHRVDIFVPRRRRLAIAKAYEQFQNAGVLLLLDKQYEVLSMLENKAMAYDYFRAVIPAHIPEYKVAHSAEEFLDAYMVLSKSAKRVCYKLIEDEGARSFRVIDNRISELGALWEKPGVKVTLDLAKQIISQYDFKVPILIMPYLSGVEVSVDCLSTPSGKIIIPRFKTSKRYSEVVFDKTIMDVCSRIMDKLRLQHPLNIQFKFEDGQFYLLEVNSRMSGGLQLSCMATGINIPDIAVCGLIGEWKTWSYPLATSQKVVHIETPIRIEDV